MEYPLNKNARGHFRGSTAGLFYNVKFVFFPIYL